MNTNVKKISALALAGLMMGLTAAPVFADNHEGHDKSHQDEHDSSSDDESCGGDEGCAGEE